MTKRMLIDATHPEETRVVVLNGTRLEEFDVETSTKKPLKGNIYLAKIVRVEPSLQAAFVEYGGNRHGFLAFSEIHPDYYQIPKADREALIAAQRARAVREDRDFADFGDEAEENARAQSAPSQDSEQPVLEDAAPASEDSSAPETNMGYAPSYNAETVTAESARDTEPSTNSDSALTEREASAPIGHVEDVDFGSEITIETVGGEGSTPVYDEDDAEDEGEAQALRTNHDSETISGEPIEIEGEYSEIADDADDTEGEGEGEESEEGDADNESGDDASAEASGEPRPEGAARPPRRRGKSIRHYKIQEVIKRRQIILVQVVKEERGNKGAALTTYMSLAGRYCVLMPNTARGGGVSRKITSAADRRRLKEAVSEMDIPDSMAVIVRTAGSDRTKAEIQRDYEYLLRTWNSVRELTLQSSAPALVYEEANLIKRAIRDLYSRDIDEVHVEGEEGYSLAKEFMRILTPSHLRKVQLYRDPAIPLFHRYQVEAQLDAMHNNVVTLRSGGYIVLNQTEALVAIDVNSGRATRERHIEETALRTNVEAAEEVARQLRLRDLAGLIVIDFIDMEERRNIHTVERRLKEAMRHDRARIQIGRISPFGLMELSRQRLRPSLMETSFLPCPHCAGTGQVRSVESSSMHVLRAIEEEGIRQRAPEIIVSVALPVALYILNQKRAALNSLEMRHRFRVLIQGDDSLMPPNFKIERIKNAPRLLDNVALPVRPESVAASAAWEQNFEEPEEEVIAETESEAEEPARAETRSEEENNRRRRRRRRGRGRGREDRNDERGESQDENLGEVAADSEDADTSENAPTDDGEAVAVRQDGESVENSATDEDGRPRKRRRRGRRGGRRRTRTDADGVTVTEEIADQDGDEDANDSSEGESAYETEQPATAYAAEPLTTHSDVAVMERPALAAEPIFTPAPVPPVQEQAPAVETPAPAPPAPAPEEKAGPPRRGWWNRLLS